MMLSVRRCAMKIVDLVLIVLAVCGAINRNREDEPSPVGEPELARLSVFQIFSRAHGVWCVNVTRVGPATRLPQTLCVTT